MRVSVRPVRGRELLLTILITLVASFTAPRASSTVWLGNEREVEPSDAVDNLRFGVDVAISGDTAVVGIESYKAGRGTTDYGAAYVFERDASGDWTETKRLTSSDQQFEDYFGERVAISGDTILVTARFHGGDVGPNTGAVYVFERDVGGPGNWGEAKKLTASDAAAGDVFGTRMAFSGDTALIGAPGDDPTGSVYVLERNEGGADNWGEVRKIAAADLGVSDGPFGYGLAIDGDRALVGAASDAPDVDPDVVWVLERDAGGPENWGGVKALTEWNAPGDRFGTPVAISGDVVAVGGSDEFFSQAIYVFERDAGGAGNWGRVQRFAAADADGCCSGFGGAIALSGDRLLIGAKWIDNGLPDKGEGAAFVYGRDVGGPSHWGVMRKIVPVAGLSGPPDDEFGRSVAMDGNTAIIGAPYLDGAGSESGAAYMYVDYEPCEAQVAQPCLDGWGKARLAVDERRSGRERLTLKLAAGPALESITFGNPVSGVTAYDLCLYGDSGDLAGHVEVHRAASSDCGGRLCWRRKGRRGYGYVDKSLSADGVRTMKLLGGAAGKSSILLKGKNDASKGQTSLPTGIAAALGGATHVTVQLHASDAVRSCYGATLDTVTANDGSSLKAK